MLRLMTIWVMCCLYAFSLSCSKDGSTTPGTVNPPPPPPTEKVFSISGLQYTPSAVAIKTYAPTFTITGSVDFLNASGGIARLRLHTSAGWDTTIVVDGMGQGSGKVTGLFELTRPIVPVQFSFDLWLVDASGKESNKLTGMVSVLLDDSGANWSSQQIGILRVLNDIGWYNNQFISVGNGGTIGTSPDGINWTLRPIPKNNNFRSVTWTGSMYVAVGDFGMLFTSPDGINWTDRSLTDEYMITLASVCWSGAQLVIVGETSYPVGGTFIMSSADGFNWTRSKLSIARSELRSVIWTGSQFVAVGIGRTPDKAYPMLLTSPDGTSWTDRSMTDGSNGLYDVVQAGNETLAIGPGILVRSANGSSWTRQPISVTGIYALAWSGRKLVGVGNGIFTSDEGIDWMQASPGNNLMDYLKCVAWNGTMYVAAGQYERTIMVSP
jgi:photosystem II stability/assembly factor-like uncharacterized protein